MFMLVHSVMYLKHVLPLYALLKQQVGDPLQD